MTKTKLDKLFDVLDPIEFFVGERIIPVLQVIFGIAWVAFCLWLAVCAAFIGR